MTDLATELERLQQLAEEVARLLPKTPYWQVIVTRRGYGGHECEYRTEEGVRAAELPDDVADVLDYLRWFADSFVPGGEPHTRLTKAADTITALSRQIAEREAEIARSEREKPCKNCGFLPEKAG